MFSTCRVAVASLALMAIGSAASGSDAVSPLVSTAWVAEHLEDPELLLVHVAMAHDGSPRTLLPGAVYLDYHAIETSESLPIEMPPVAELVETFRSVGVDADDHVVLYGPAPAHVAARAFVALEYIGHRRVSVMDGGLEAWLDEKRPSSAAPASATRGSFEARVEPDLLVDAEWIHARLDDPQVVLIDARPADQFEGPSLRGLRPGHIPGSRNLYFVELLRSERVHRVKSMEEARRLFEAAGAGPDKTLVSYCQIGMRASYNYLVARQLGYEVRFYDPSWVEWGSRAELPAETGPAAH